MPDSHLVTFTERLGEARGVPPVPHVSTNNDQTPDTELLDLAAEAHPQKKRHCDWFIPAVLGFLLCPWTGICAVYYAVRGNCTSDLEKDEETVKRHNRRAKYLTVISIVLGLIAIGSCITILMLIRQSVFDTRAELSYEMDQVHPHHWVADNENENSNEMQQTEWQSQDSDGENANVYYDRDMNEHYKDSENSEYSNDEDDSHVKNMQQDRREDVNSAPAYYDEDDQNENYKDSTYNDYYEDYYGDGISMNNGNGDTNPSTNDYTHDYENTYDSSSEDRSHYYDEYQPEPPNPYYQYDSYHDGQYPYDRPSEQKPDVTYDDQQTKDEWPTYVEDENEHNATSEESDGYYKENEGYYNADMPAGSYLVYYDDGSDAARTKEIPDLVNNDDGKDVLLTHENPDNASNENDYPYYEVKPSDNNDDETDSSERTFPVNNDIYMGKDRNATSTGKPVYDFYQYPLKTAEYQSQDYSDSYMYEDENGSEQYPFNDYSSEESEASSISDAPEAGNYSDTDMTDPTLQQDDYYDNVYEHDLSYYENPVGADTNDTSNIKEVFPAKPYTESDNISAKESEDVDSEEDSTDDQDNQPIAQSSEEEEEVYLRNEGSNYQSKQQTIRSMYDAWTTKSPFQYRLYTAGATKRGTSKQPLWKRFGYKK